MMAPELLIKLAKGIPARQRRQRAVILLEVTAYQAHGFAETTCPACGGRGMVAGGVICPICEGFEQVPESLSFWFERATFKERRGERRA